MNVNLSEVSVPSYPRDSGPGSSAPVSAVPRHPGRYLEERLRPQGITQTQLAVALRVSRRRVNELIRGRRGITPDTALRLAACVGQDALFWMHLQVVWDLHLAAKELARAPVAAASAPRAGQQLASSAAE